MREIGLQQPAGYLFGLESGGSSDQNVSLSRHPFTNMSIWRQISLFEQNAKLLTHHDPPLRPTASVTCWSAQSVLAASHSQAVLGAETCDSVDRRSMFSPNGVQVNTVGAGIYDQKVCNRRCVWGADWPIRPPSSN